ncbi:methyltransferase domain-containing protein [bacterium]|nr:methyltransferase domain-containing protein [bacterium]
MNTPDTMIETHNQTQLDYFGKKIKDSMVPEASPYVVRQVDRLLACSKITQSERVLDLGCGMGKYTLEMARRGIQVEGLDLSPFLLEKFREYDGGRYNIPLYESDIIKFPPQLLARFDVITGFFVLHHVHDLEACFTACFHMLKPGGRIVFLEPNALNPLYYFQITFTPGMTWEGDGGVVKMRKGLMFRSMKNAGLTDTRLERFGFFPRFITNLPGIGLPLESVFEKIPLWKFALPFQLFTARKPAV